MPLQPPFAFNRYVSQSEDLLFHKTAAWLKELQPPYVVLISPPPLMCADAKNNNIRSTLA